MLFEFIYISLIQLLCLIQGFLFIEKNPKNIQFITLIEGTSVSLFCPNDPEYNGDQFDSCKITHDQNCYFEQKILDGYVTDQTKCESVHRYEFKFSPRSCELKLKSVVMEDAGKWTCNWVLEQGIHGAGELYGEIKFNVIPSSNILIPPFHINDKNALLESIPRSKIGFPITDIEIKYSYEEYYEYDDGSNEYLDRDNISVEKLTKSFPAEGLLFIYIIYFLIKLQS